MPTEISWTDETWNPTVGCSKVSPGCKGCYAIRDAHRLAGNPNPKISKVYQGLTVIQNGAPNWTGVVRLIEERLADPLRWRKPRRVFVNSMSDLFHEALPDEAIDRVFAVMALCPQHTFQVLTKRPERMRDYCSSDETRWRVGIQILAIDERLPPKDGRSIPLQFRPDSTEDVPKLWALWPLPNVQLGVSVEDQPTADARIPLLLQTPAAVWFISAEPLLGPIELAGPLYPDSVHQRGSLLEGAPMPGIAWAKIDWVITGGESGPGARPSHPQWFRDVRDACLAAGVPYHHKQNGEWLPFDQRIYRVQAHWGAGAVKTVQRHDGAVFNGEVDGWASSSVSMMPCVRVGKKVTGRLLDGVLHDEFPEVRHA